MLYLCFSLFEVFSFFFGEDSLLPAFLLGSMATPNTMAFENLTRRHGVKIDSNANVEDVCLAVGDVVGHENIVSASRMNNAFVVFFRTIEKANEIVQNGVVIKGSLTPVFPLSTPAKKIMISNIPPFVKDEIIVQELSRYGKIVSPIKKIPLGCKSPLVKHLVSFRRQVFMILKDGEDELDLVFKFKIDSFDYVVFASSDTTIKCFGCGKIGHLSRNCPDKVNKNAEQIKADQAGSASAVAETSVPAAASLEAESSLVASNAPLDEPLAGVNSAGTPGSGSPVDDGVVVEESVAVENAVGLSKTVFSAFVEQDRDTVKEDLRLNDCELEMEIESVFKTPIKRKKNRNDKTSKQVKKGDAEEEIIASDDDDSDSSVSVCSEFSACSQNETINVLYKAEDISVFLQETKGLKGVQIEDYFPNRAQFVKDTRYLMKEGAFSDLEVYRLRKFVNKLKKQIHRDEKNAMV